VRGSGTPDSFLPSPKTRPRGQGTQPFFFLRKRDDEGNESRNRNPSITKLLIYASARKKTNSHFPMDLSSEEKGELCKEAFLFLRGALILGHLALLHTQAWLAGLGLKGFEDQWPFFINSTRVLQPRLNTCKWEGGGWDSWGLGRDDPIFLYLSLPSLRRRTLLSGPLAEEGSGGGLVSSRARRPGRRLLVPTASLLPAPSQLTSTLSSGRILTEKGARPLGLGRRPVFK
jgi:hypothetical protein